MYTPRFSRAILAGAGLALLLPASPSRADSCRFIYGGCTYCDYFGERTTVCNYQGTLDPYAPQQIYTEYGPTVCFPPFDYPFPVLAIQCPPSAPSPVGNPPYNPGPMPEPGVVVWQSPDPNSSYFFETDFTLAWSVGGGGQPTHYELEWESQLNRDPQHPYNMVFTTIYSGSSSAYTMPVLGNDMGTFRVRACNAAGCGPYSPELAATLHVPGSGPIDPPPECTPEYPSCG